MSRRHFGPGLRRASAAVVMTVTMLAVGGCGASETPPVPAPAATVPTPTAAVTSVAAAASEEAASAEAAASAETTPATKPAAAKVEVPRGVGLDYQSAQDLWRGAGLIVAPAKDATGANRIPVIDSNWIVVSQDLKAGSKVAAGSLITATVKKDSD